MSKWQKQFEQHGLTGLHGCPRRSVKQKVGLIGAHGIRCEVCKVSGGKSLPSLSTIKRALRWRGPIAEFSQLKQAYFPKPLQVVSGR